MKVTADCQQNFVQSPRVPRLMTFCARGCKRISSGLFTDFPLSSSFFSRIHWAVHELSSKRLQIGRSHIFVNLMQLGLQSWKEWNWTANPNREQIYSGGNISLQASRPSKYAKGTPKNINNFGSTLEPCIKLVNRYLITWRNSPI